MGSRKSNLKTDSSGQYYRQIGQKRGLTGQPKFRLGADLAKAELAYHKLGLLWRAEVEQHERMQQAGTHFDSSDAPQPTCWSDVGLAIAEGIRKHLHVVRIGRSEHIEGDAAYATHLDFLRQRYGHLVQIMPADTEAAERGKQEHRQYAEHRSRQARLNARIASIPIPAGMSGVTLYQAIDGYAEQVEQSSRKEGAKVEAANARRLKDSTPDMDMSDFGYSALEQIKQYWAARPEAKLRAGKTTGRPISLTTVDNHLSTARRFVRWLDRADAYSWEMPRHGLDALKVNLKRLQSSEEIAGRRHGVKVLTVEQLTVCYQHATDYERLLLLLGLNAAMAQAEVCTLRWDEIEANPPLIRRVRHKSEVLGMFELWPQTQQALEWWKGLHSSQSVVAKVGLAAPELVMITSGGLPYTRQRIATSWVQLRRRIERADGIPCDWWLSYKHLRKTIAQMVRQVSDGEIAAVLLSHGQPVESDHLSNEYSNRPFGKVAEALRQVGRQLAPMFAAAPEAFKATSMGRGTSRRQARSSRVKRA